jgi:hypothetical protein
MENQVVEENFYTHLVALLLNLHISLSLLSLNAGRNIFTSVHERMLLRIRILIGILQLRRQVQATKKNKQIT